MATCRSIYRNHRGSATPFEDLIVHLTIIYETGRRLPDPDMIERRCAEYREEYDDALALARQLVAEHPDLFSQKPIQAA